MKCMISTRICCKHAFLRQLDASTEVAKVLQHAPIYAVTYD